MRQKSEKLIRNHNKPGYGKGRQMRWNKRKMEIRAAVEAMGVSAWRFFVKERERGYQENKCVQESWEDAYELTCERFGGEQGGVEIVWE